MFFTGIGEIYLVCAAVGMIYMAFAILMGQVGHMGGHGGGHGISHGHVGVSGHAGHGTGGGHAGGGHLHIGHGTGGHAAGGHAAIPGHTAGHAPAPAGHAAPGQSLPGHSATGPGGDSPVSNNSQIPTGSFLHVHAPAGNIDQFMSLLLTLFSPMTMSMFVSLFGLAGIFLLQLAPSLGLITLLPAGAVSLFATAQLMRLLEWMMQRVDVTTSSRQDEFIGQMGQVNTSIKSGHMGEVICELGSKRYNFPARGKDPSGDLPSGSKVIISDIRDGVLYVEPWDDLWLATDNIIDTSTVKNKLPEQ